MIGISESTVLHDLFSLYTWFVDVFRSHAKMPVASAYGGGGTKSV